MEPVDLHVLPHPSDAPLEHDLVEIEAAIELVRQGVAERVRLVSLVAVERVAGVALARAQAADVSLTYDPTGPAPVLTIGPRR